MVLARWQEITASKWRTRTSSITMIPGGVEHRVGPLGLYYEEVAEILYTADGAFPVPVNAIQGWLDSKEGHREALLDPNLRVVGVGVLVRGQISWAVEIFMRF